MDLTPDSAKGVDAKDTRDDDEGASITALDPSALDPFHRVKANPMSVVVPASPDPYIRVLNVHVPAANVPASRSFVLKQFDPF